VILPVLILLTLPAVQDGRSEALRLPLDRARDATADGLAFVETSTSRAEAYAGEAVRVKLAFGIEQRFLREKLVQPFGAHLDLPVQLRAPWIEGSGGRVVPLPIDASGDASGAPETFALNETVERAPRAAERTVGGKTFVVHEVEVELVAGAGAELVLPAPVLGFAYADRFEETFLDGRAPADRTDAFVAGAPRTLAIRPLPEEGRPPEFLGAVGSFTVHAEAEPREVLLGESLKLRLRIAWERSSGAFEAPGWKEIGGFKVLGVVDAKEPGSRTLTYDLEPVSDRVWQIPAIPFTYFDPEPPAGYRTVRTDPIEITVRRAEEAAPVAPPREAARAAARYGPWLYGTGLVLVVVLVLVLARRGR
jgi:hypothetical protein